MAYRVHVDDARSIRAIVSLDENDPIPDEIVNEYSQWMEMSGLAGFTGSLGNLVVPMLRYLGMSVDIRVDQNDRIDWPSIEFGSTVRARSGNRAAYGEYIGIGRFGGVLVRIDGNPMIEEFNAFEVELLDEDDIALANMEMIALEAREKTEKPDSKPTKKEKSISNDE